MPPQQLTNPTRLRSTRNVRRPPTKPGNAVVVDEICRSESERGRCYDRLEHHGLGLHVQAMGYGHEPALLAPAPELRDRVACRPRHHRVARPGGVHFQSLKMPPQPERFAANARISPGVTKLGDVHCRRIRRQFEHRCRPTSGATFINITIALTGFGKPLVPRLMLSAATPQRTAQP